MLAINKHMQENVRWQRTHDSAQKIVFRSVVSRFNLTTLLERVPDTSTDPSEHVQLRGELMSGCFLESYLADGESVYRIQLNSFPALVGRETGLAVTLQSNNVSRQHAEFIDDNGHLLIRDLGSTNGTYVNHEKIFDSYRLRTGDVIRFADVEFRLREEGPVVQRHEGDEPTATAFFYPEEHVNRLPVGAKQLEELLHERMIKPLFQAIVSVDNGRITGLELLGRGSHPTLSELPVPLFFLAEGLGRGVELSELIREIGVKAWANSNYRDLPLFMNTHPHELRDGRRLADSLQGLWLQYPELPMVLEIHEQAVTDQETLAQLSSDLKRIDMLLAYDDFGAGQARLLELLDVPPYAVKFDISLIRDVHKTSRDRREMIELLVRMVKTCGALALAEGVSRTEELEVCRELDFDLIQGYVYGEPTSLEQLPVLPGRKMSGKSV